MAGTSEAREPEREDAREKGREAAVLQENRGG
jgi:hypothetical protein